MKIIQHLIIAVLIVGIIFSNFGTTAMAQSAHYPLADTYTDSANPNNNYGNNAIIGISASNLAGCITIRSLWFKFTVPSTSQTISDASLFLIWRSGQDSNLPLELRSSSVTSWVEYGDGGITYNNQPALDPGELATSPSVPPGGTVEFTGATFAAYLEAHKGQTITLVVLANCDAPSDPVGSSVNRSIYSRNSPDGPDAYIEMFTPTAVEFTSLSASSGSGALGNTTIGLVTALVAVPALFLIGVKLTLRRRQS